jgi:hypothetical protein
MFSVEVYINQVKAMKPGDILRLSTFDAFKMQEDGTLRIIVTNTDGREVIPMASKTRQDYKLTIKPALKPGERHKIECALEKLGYKVHGGGTDTDMSQCDVSFSK